MNERACVKFSNVNNGGPYEYYFFTVSLLKSAGWLVIKRNLLSSPQPESMAGCWYSRQFPAVLFYHIRYLLHSTH